jgi:hypothetical protein
MTASTLTASQIELQAFIKAENAEFVSRSKAKGYVVPSSMVSDAAHWAEHGIYTVKEYLHSSAASEHSDFFKEINNFRPRWNYSEMTTEEINLAIGDLSRQAKLDVEYEKELKMAQEVSHQERIKKNSYKPNFAFAGLKNSLS